MVTGRGVIFICCADLEKYIKTSFSFLKRAIGYSNKYKYTVILNLNLVLMDYSRKKHTWEDIHWRTYPLGFFVFFTLRQEFPEKSRVRQLP